MTGSSRIINGDSVEALREFSDGYFDSIVTDPPYELGFMNKGWDAAGIAYNVDMWSECFRVLKPGGHLLAFGGTRTYHRMACAIEDAGFEIRDSLHWIYGSGFPKSLDVSKAIDKAKRGRPQGGPDPESPNSGKYSRLPSRGGGPGSWQSAARAEGIDPSTGRKIIGLHPNPAGNKPGGAAYDMSVTGMPEQAYLTEPLTEEAKHWQGWGTALKPAHEIVIAARKPPANNAILEEIGSRLNLLEQQWSPTVRVAGKSSGHIHPESPEAKIDSVPENAVISPEAERVNQTVTGEAGDSSVLMDMLPSGWTEAMCSNTVTSWKNCWTEICGLMSMSTIEITSRMTTDLRTLSSCLAKITHENTIQDETRVDGRQSLVMAADNLFAAVLSSLRAILMLFAAENATSFTQENYQDGDANHCPIMVARKPLAGTVAGNVLQYGTGGVNIDGCRVGSQGGCEGATAGPSLGIYGNGLNGERSQPVEGLGRWPANILLTHSAACSLVGEKKVVTGTAYMEHHKGEYEASSYHMKNRPKGVFTYGEDGRETVEAWDCAPDCPVAQMDMQSGSVGGFAGLTGDEPSAAVKDVYGDRARIPWQSYEDEGGASRFFPCFRYNAKAAKHERPKGDVAHPTVKPVALMQWLVRLVTPENGIVLDPFAGSGTTGQACSKEGFRYVLIERDPDYIKLINKRLAQPTLFEEWDDD